MVDTRRVRAGRRSLAALGTALLLGACGGGDGGEDSGGGTTVTAAATATSTGSTAVSEPSTSAAAGGAVSDLEGVESATVRIVAEGTFADPEGGLQYNVPGSGSGFIVDPSGLAVTNNHVVTGAAFLEVFVAGEDEPRNAQVLGVSECSDLAVIDIDGEGFPYLSWYEGTPTTGMDVYAAGFPLGDPEFTLTRGIVSKDEADGETSWASVDAVLEHDATINPGNSGGPLVTEDGQVVGVNYAGSGETDQSFAISRAEALAVIDELAAGSDVTSLGVNGEVISDEAGELSGIWVASVESGSPADTVGIQAGDIITRLEGLVLGLDGTMSDYCDILRTRSADEVMAVEVLRNDTDEVLEGRLNGEPLEVSFSFAEELGGDIGEEATEDTVPATYQEYTTVSDDTAAISVDVPVEWSDLNGAPRDSGPSIVAAVDANGFLESYDVPGVEVTATRDVAAADIDSLLDEISSGVNCTETLPREDYADPLYTGRFQAYDGCGDSGAGYVVVAATPAEADYVVLVLVNVVTDADLDALDRILDTFVVTGEV